MPLRSSSDAVSVWGIGGLVASEGTPSIVSIGYHVVENRMSLDTIHIDGVVGVACTLITLRCPVIGAGWSWIIDGTVIFFCRAAYSQTYCGTERLKVGRIIELISQVDGRDLLGD